MKIIKICDLYTRASAFRDTILSKPIYMTLDNDYFRCCGVCLEPNNALYIIASDVEGYLLRYQP